MRNGSEHSDGVPGYGLHLLELPKTSLMPVPKSPARRSYDKAALYQNLSTVWRPVYK